MPLTYEDLITNVSVNKSKWEEWEKQIRYKDYGYPYVKTNNSDKTKEIIKNALIEEANKLKKEREQLEEERKKSEGVSKELDLERSELTWEKYEFNEEKAKLNQEREELEKEKADLAKRRERVEAKEMENSELVDLIN